MTIAQKLNEIKEQIVQDVAAAVVKLEQDRPSFKAPPEQLRAYNDERDKALQTLSLVYGRLPSYRVRGSMVVSHPVV